MASKNKNPWDDYADIYMEKMGREGDYWNRELILPPLFRLCGDDLTGKRALDLGCGFGHVAMMLEERGAAVVGLDSSEVLLEEARHEAGQRGSSVEFILSDASMLPFTDEDFDLIVCNMALQDFADADAALREAARVSRPGARAIFAIRHPWTDGWLGDYHECQAIHTPLQPEWQGRSPRSHYPPRYHRPLDYYLNASVAAELAFVHCEEIVCDDSLLVVLLVVERKG